MGTAAPHSLVSTLVHLVIILAKHILGQGLRHRLELDCIQTEKLLARESLLLG